MYRKWDSEVELYNLYFKDYADVVGPLCHPPYQDEEKGGREDFFENSDRINCLSFYNFRTLSDNEVNDYGEFRRSFRSLDEAKEYAMYYVNANSYGNKNTVIKDTGDVLKDHKLRVEQYEAYLTYRKYYQEILAAICHFDGYDSEASGGGGFLFRAVLEAVPEITEKQLSLIWHDIPLVLEKRTQRYIEKARENSLKYINRGEG